MTKYKTSLKKLTPSNYYCPKTYDIKHDAHHPAMKISPASNIGVGVAASLYIEGV